MADRITINITKCRIPIIWIDTSIINIMTQWKHKLGPLDRLQKERASKLYNLIQQNVTKGRLICPLAEQEEEVWIERDKWFHTIQSLSLGMETDTLFDIQNKQRYQFMKAFINNDTTITLSYADAFSTDPITELTDTISRPIFITVNRPLLFGNEYHKRIKTTIYQQMEEQRKKNVEAPITFEQQREREYAGELQALLIQQQQFFQNNFVDEHDQLNATCGTLHLNYQLKQWEILTKDRLDYMGLVNFYKSDYYKLMPYTSISCNLMAKLMTDAQPIRRGDEKDIKHASTLLPFSNIYITDKAMARFLKQQGYDKLYNTTVCYIGDTQIIDNFFDSIKA